VTAPIALVVATAENGVIGKDGDLPWRLPQDLKRFKALTLGKPIIMGRKTWDSLPKKPLPGRTNIVVTRDAGFPVEGAQRAGSFDEALRIAGRENPSEISVIGGAAIFEMALLQASRIYLTEVEGAIEGDVVMPRFDRSRWREIERKGPFREGALRYSFVTLERWAVGSERAHGYHGLSGLLFAHGLLASGRAPYGLSRRPLGLRALARGTPATGGLASGAFAGRFTRCSCLA
jgi:dihydrofolate reductase